MIKSSQVTCKLIQQLPDYVPSCCKHASESSRDCEASKASSQERRSNTVREKTSNLESHTRFRRGFGSVSRLRRDIQWSCRHVASSGVFIQGQNKQLFLDVIGSRHLTGTWCYLTATFVSGAVELSWWQTDESLPTDAEFEGRSTNFAVCPPHSRGGGGD